MPVSQQSESPLSAPVEARPAAIDIIDDALQLRLATKAADRPLVLGVCGAQGSGKSTIAYGLRQRLEARGLRTAILSLDDLYLSRKDPERLASTIHPLLETRGVPGTHDVELGEAALDLLSGAGKTLLPRFDKASDNPRSPGEWEPFEGPADLIIFEGWCVGARPQMGEDLAQPVNPLEADDDSDGGWRRWVNDQLASDYQRLFDRIDMLVLLAAPGFEVVAAWRSQQEKDLRDRLTAAGMDTRKTLSDDGILRFIQHYQRLTEHILSDMPSYAHLVVRLDAGRRPSL